MGVSEVGLRVSGVATKWRAEAEASPEDVVVRGLRIAVFLDHDIMVRHFLRSGALDDLLHHHDVTLVLPPEGSRRLTSDITLYADAARIIRLNVPVDRRALWSRLTQVAAMRLSFDRHARYMRRTWRRTMNWKAAILYTVLGLPGAHFVFRHWSYTRLNRSGHYELQKLLDDGAFDLVVNPGVPIGIYIEDLTVETRRRGIPFIHIMNSWDNPSLAILPASLPDYYAVWGKQTANHAVRYLGMPSDRVIELGAAQFEIYNQPPRIDRQTFCERHDIDVDHRILLYAGGSLGTNEYQHLQVIEQRINDGEFGSVTVVYRPHPWGGGGNAGEQIIAHAWKHIRIETTMRNYLEALKERGYHMTFPDYRDTHDVLSSVDCVISPLSTIIIEAALHSKPVMCFLPLEDKNAEHFQSVYDLPHFEDLLVDENILVARGRSELGTRTKELLTLCDDPSFGERIAETCRLFVPEFDEPYGKRLRELAEQIVRQADHGDQRARGDAAAAP